MVVQDRVIFSLGVDGPEINSTTGKDNTVGATRTVIFENITWVERLVGYHSTATESAMEFSLANGPVLYAGTQITTYTEQFFAKSICGGTAVYYAMTVTFCSNKNAKLYDIYDKYRRAAVQKVADELGAYVFSGTCPIGELAVCRDT
ncbi:hypothetical protein H0H92_001880 [Tricholoma furcatifolium]|nr:hypothetical protein H0H92_001880 [Tricholoma furcatifolium]